MLPVTDYMAVAFTVLVVGVQEPRVSVKRGVRHEVRVVELCDFGGYGYRLLFSTRRW
jgi:hypothetical protein